MGLIFQKIFCVSLVVFVANASLAQVADDIPIYFAEDKYTPPVQPKKTQVPAPQTPKVQERKEPIFFSAQQSTPNIGRSTQPLTKVELFPPPAPNLEIKIPQPTQKVQTPIQKEPVNTRIEAITLSKDEAKASIDNLTSNIIPSGSGGSSTIGPTNDVRGFELEGFYLGMTPDEIIQIAKDRNYKITSSKNTISKFRAGYYESLCKSRKIYLPADIRACINEMSQKNDTTYLAELKIARPKTRDFVEFYFTSPATNNRLWKMVYQNKGDNSLNFTRVNTQKKIARRDAFLNAIYNKFGHPDNAQKLIWGSENDAFMQIGIYGSNYDAYITLTDVFLSDDDYFEAEDWRQENQPFEHFGFED